MWSKQHFFRGNFQLKSFSRYSKRHRINTNISYRSLSGFQIPGKALTSWSTSKMTFVVNDGHIQTFWVWAMMRRATLTASLPNCLANPSTFDCWSVNEKFKFLQITCLMHWRHRYICLQYVFFEKKYYKMLNSF